MTYDRDDYVLEVSHQFDAERGGWMTCKDQKKE